MCIVLDICALSRVLNHGNREHRLFIPVWDWIVRGPGTIVYGGTRYLNELAEAPKLMATVKILQDKGKAQPEPREKVDAEEKRVRRKLQHPDFNDQHIVAILLVSGCLLVCTADKNAHRFLRHKAFFNHKHRRPHVYSGPGSKGILRPKYIPRKFQGVKPMCRTDIEELETRGHK